MTQLMARVASTLGLSCAAFALAATCVAQDSVEDSAETSTADIEQCVAQHESARQLRLQEHWLAARAAMSGCAAERCPLAIASDCRAWLDELERVLPTLLIVVEREEPTVDPSLLRVELDGKALLLPEPPTPLELLPGAHHLRFELGSRPAIERNFVLQRGEKNHLEQVRFVRQPAPPVLASAAQAAPRAPVRPVTPATYWFSGGALAAFGGSVALLALGVREHRDAQVQCAPACDRATRNSIESKLVLADIAGGVGIALTGLAVYSYWRRPVVFDAARSPTTGPVLATSGRDFRLLWQGAF